MQVDQLRQIAILIDGLDQRTADELLEQFSPDQQRAIRDALLSLEGVTDRERSDVVRTFVNKLGEHHTAALTQAHPPCPTSNAVPDGVFHHNHEAPAGDLLRSETLTARPIACVASLQPLADALRKVSVAALATALAGERPQAVAVVVAALPPDRAASFVAHMPRDQQPDILRRVARLAAADEPAIEALAEALLGRLAEQRQQVSTQEPIVGRVRKLMGHVDSSVRARVLDQLSESDRELFAPMRPGGTNPTRHSAPTDPQGLMLAMDRLVDWDRDELMRLFSEVEENIAALALLGASQPCCDELLARVDGDLASSLRRAMSDLGSWRLSDVRHAQQFLLATARRMRADPEHDPQAHLKLMA